MGKKGNDITLGAMAFVLEQLSFNSLRDGFLSPEEESIYKGLRKEMFNKGVFTFDKNLLLFSVISKIFPEKILTIVDKYAPNIPYSKNARSQFSIDQINDLEKPCNIVSLGSGFDCKWLQAFEYNKDTNKLIHKETNSDSFDLYLVDGSKDQNDIFTKVLEEKLGKIPENLHIKTVDLSVEGWSKDLVEDPGKGTFYQSNGLLAYFNKDAVDKILTEAFNSENSLGVTASFVVASKKAQEIFSEEAEARRQQKGGAESEEKTYPMETIKELEEFLYQVAEKYNNKLKKLGVKIDFDMEKLIGFGKEIAPIYKASGKEEEYREAGIEKPGTEVIASMKISETTNEHNLQI